MVKINTLSDADVILLKEMADYYRKRLVGRVDDANELHPSEGPDTYIVRVPDDGIPAMVGEEPGFADDCDFYRISSDNPPVMQKVCMLRRVFNLSTTALTTSYALVTRTKAGLWITASGKGGGNSVAYTTTVIPGRVDDKPGGPITVTKKVLAIPGTATASSSSTALFDGVLVDGDEVEVYSWASSDSLSNVYIFIEQDEAGYWWFTGEDCAV
jgi:hypothetical protein